LELRDYRYLLLDLQMDLKDSMHMVGNMVCPLNGQAFSVMQIVGIESLSTNLQRPWVVNSRPKVQVFNLDLV